MLSDQSTEHPDYRGYSGRIEGVFKGDKITVLPSGFGSRIKSIDTFDGPIKSFSPMSVLHDIRR